MKAVILARVSTEEQREANNSLPAQIDRMERYCSERGLDIKEKYSFDESAYKTKRDEFDKVLEYVDKHKEKIAVCFDKVDRLSRNVFDKRVSILYEKALADEVELHFVSDGQIINSDISAVDKFRFGMSLGLAKYYSDAISDNVRRAFELKRKRGEWPGSPPIGYKNTTREDGKKHIAPDPEKAHFIPIIFKEYIKGSSIRSLADLMNKQGLRGNRGGAISPSMIHDIIRNPFYSGTAYSKTRDIEYEHIYEPLISKRIFREAQSIREGWHKKPFDYKAKPFMFRGLIRCKRCGCAVTPEIKKGKYVYYSCTNYKGMCKRVYIREKKILDPVYEVLNGISLPQNKIDFLVEELKKLNETKNRYHNEAIRSLDHEYEIIESRLEKLMDVLLDGSITKEEYDKKHKSLRGKQEEVLVKKEEHTRADENYYITAATVLNLAKQAKEIFDSSEVTEKRQLLSYLFQNSVLDGEKVEFTLRSPFNELLEASSSRLVRG